MQLQDMIAARRQSPSRQIAKKRTGYRGYGVSISREKRGKPPPESDFCVPKTVNLRVETMAINKSL